MKIEAINLLIPLKLYHNGTLYFAILLIIGTFATKVLGN